MPSEDAGTATGVGARAENVAGRAEDVADHTGSRLERMGLGRTAGGLLLVTAGVLVLAMPELLTLVVGVGAVLLGVLVLATADEGLDR